MIETVFNQCLLTFIGVTGFIVINSSYSRFGSGLPERIGWENSNFDSAAPPLPIVRHHLMPSISTTILPLDQGVTGNSLLSIVLLQPMHPLLKSVRINGKSETNRSHLLGALCKRSEMKLERSDYRIPMHVTSRVSNLELFYNVTCTFFSHVASVATSRVSNF